MSGSALAVVAVVAVVAAAALDRKPNHHRRLHHCSFGFLLLRFVQWLLLLLSAGSERCDRHNHTAIRTQVAIHHNNHQLCANVRRVLLLLLIGTASHRDTTKRTWSSQF